MLAALPGTQRKTVGADKAFDTEEFVSGCRALNVTPHVAQNTYEYDTRTGKRAKRESRIDARITRHEGYRVSQVIRKLIETVFGDGKQHGATIRQVKLRGIPKVSDVFTLSMLAVNLRRLPRLLAAQAMAGKRIDRRGASAMAIGLKTALPNARIRLRDLANRSDECARSFDPGRSAMRAPNNRSFQQTVKGTKTGSAHSCFAASKRYA